MDRTWICCRILLVACVCVQSSLHEGDDPSCDGAFDIYFVLDRWVVNTSIRERSVPSEQRLSPLHVWLCLILHVTALLHFYNLGVISCKVSKLETFQQQQNNRCIITQTLMDALQFLVLKHMFVRISAGQAVYQDTGMTSTDLWSSSPTDLWGTVSKVLYVVHIQSIWKRIVSFKTKICRHPVTWQPHEDAWVSIVDVWVTIQTVAVSEYKTRACACWTADII